MTTATKASARRRMSRMLSKQQVFIVLLLHVLALVALPFASVINVVGCLVLHAITGLFGISLGFHRLMAHNAYRCPRWLRNVLATIGVLAFQGGPLTWVAFHRSHHVHTDDIGDPHSSKLGFWWSHMGWVFFKGPNGFRHKNTAALTGAFYRDSYLRFLEKNALSLNLVFFAAVLVLGGWEMALWWFPVRIVGLWHCTWLVNSFCHNSHKSNAHEGKYSAINHRLVALITYGEGLHLNHHLKPSNPYFGENRSLNFFDIGSYPIWLLEKMKLFKLKKVP